MPRRTAAALAVALLSLLLVVVPTTGARAADPPWKDTIPANGGPTDHGWFEAGRQWVGDFGDPTVVQVGGTYYAYSSPTAGRYLPVLTSTDLRTWTIHSNWSTANVGSPSYDPQADTQIPAEIRQTGQAAGWSKWDIYNHNDGLVKPPSWGIDGDPWGNDVDGPWIERAYWAPGVIQIGSNWFAYGAVRVSWTSDDPNGYGRFCLTVAEASSPLGPFRDTSGAQPLQCAPASTDPGGSIDPFPYRDPGTGKHYLLWKASGKLGGAESSLRAREIGSDGRFVAAAPEVKLLETERNDPWEGGTIENPGMVSYGGTTYLFYSGNDSNADGTGLSNYATGYAVCPSGPTAPCQRIVHSPLIASNGYDQGPGGSSPFVGPDGRLRVAYATFWWGEAPRDNGLRPRRLHIGVLERAADGRLTFLGDEDDVPPPTAPAAPPAPRAVAGDGFAHVAWDPPSSTGGMPITGYTVTRSPGGAACAVGALPRSCAFGGLTNGTPYTFTVTATNAIGTSAASPASAPVTPAVPSSVTYHPVPPARVLDTRAATQVGDFSTPFGQAEERSVVIAGRGGVPAGADAVVLNVTATGPTASSFLKLWPSGAARPGASSVNFVPGQTVANAVTVKLGPNGRLGAYNAKGSVHVIVDVVGYYDEVAGAGFTPLTPARIVDSRPTKGIGGFTTPWGEKQARDVDVTAGGVPDTADAVVLNVTATETSAASHLTVWPAGGDRPRPGPAAAL